jgi:hypothetical protein
MTELAKSVLEVLRKHGRTVETPPVPTPHVVEFRDNAGEFVFRRQGMNVAIYQQIANGVQQPGGDMFFQGAQLTPELRARIMEVCRSILR